MNEQQNNDLCEQMDLLKGEYLTLSEKLYEGRDDVDDFFADHLKRFAKIYNVIAKICGEDELATPELVLRPSLAWIRHTLYPGRYPHPDDLDDNDPSPSR